MVERVKLDAEVTIAYMRLMEDERILLERGRDAGKVEGLAEGKAEGLAESILDFLGELGPVSDKLREDIIAQTDVNVLKVWLKNAARAGSVEEFERRL